MVGAIETDRFEKVHVDSAEVWRDWLREHYAKPESVWAVTFLKGDEARYVSRFELLDEALCFGWIDGLRRKLDDRLTMQMFSKRRHQLWTATYRSRVDHLITHGKMEEPGLVAIKQSKTDGTWLSMPDVDALEVPEDLRRALGERGPAGSNFDAFSPSSRRNMLRWVAQAKTEQTRSKRIERIAELAGINQKVPLM